MADDKNTTTINHRQFCSFSALVSRNGDSDAKIAIQRDFYRLKIYGPDLMEPGEVPVADEKRLRRNNHTKRYLKRHYALKGHLSSRL